MMLSRLASAALLASGFALASPASAQVAAAGGSWQTLAPMPDIRTEVSVTTDGSLLYVLGGFGLAGGVQAPREVYAYDPASDSWTHVTDLPAGVNHAGLSHVDGSLYVIGGHREISFNPTDRLMIFDLATGDWRDGPPLPTARGGLAIAVVDGRIHAIGGETRSGATTVHEVFDTATETWSTAAPMPTAREHIAAAAVGQEIVVLGGRIPGNSQMTTNEIYDIATDSWRTGAPVPTGRSGTGAAALDGWVYFFGGEQFDNGSSTFDEAERYNPATDEWERLPDMPTARHGIGAATIGNSIYVPSGGPDAGFAFSDILERLTPDP